jgi:hypothetical protein
MSGSGANTEYKIGQNKRALPTTGSALLLALKQRATASPALALQNALI